MKNSIKKNLKAVQANIVKIGELDTIARKQMADGLVWDGCMTREQLIKLDTDTTAIINEIRDQLNTLEYGLEIVSGIPFDIYKNQTMPDEQALIKRLIG